MKFFIITGLSGAGKSSAVKAMEDIGYYCVDNMPPALIPMFADICKQSSGKIENVALVSDLRGGDLFNQLFESLNELRDKGVNYEIIFLDAADNKLVTRYKETRRNHPLSSQGTVLEGIVKERGLLSEVRSRAKYIIDTTKLSPTDLKDEIHKIALNQTDYKGIIINVVSFGFKYGIPIDSDLVLDVRFLPNPYYVPELKPKTGEDKEVRDYVFSYKQTRQFLAKLEDMIEFLIPYYVEEGKSQLVIAIGCTGGKHRSVAIANEVYAYIRTLGHKVVLQHRDYQK